MSGGKSSRVELELVDRVADFKTSPNGFEEAWFDVPEDADVAISGFGIDPGMSSCVEVCLS